MQSTASADPSATARPERALLDAFDFLVRLYIAKAGIAGTRALIHALREQSRRSNDPTPEHHLLLARRLERQLAAGQFPAPLDPIE